MKHSYQTRGTCSRRIDFELEGDIVKNVVFQGGCHGNLQGIARASEGQTVQRICEMFKGIRCGYKPTSCPDQLSVAVSAALKAETEE
ncbi:MAG: TIGR03905 family TSCPD domain-containing protein [Clostridiales bacterium]|nr:TIGR03905 family TSCPD domain-containing protein [Clostridiales bacterium]